MAKKATATDTPETPVKKKATKKTASATETKPKAAKKSDTAKATKPKTTKKAVTEEAKAPKTTRTRKTTPAKPAANIEMSEEHVRVAAYYRWVDRGMGHGNHEEDWLEAEKQIKK